jgi:ABC-2 type transport system permease protein
MFKSHFLSHKLKIYKPFAIARIQEALSYKARFVLFIIARTFTVIITYYLWKAIYNSNGANTLAGFTKNEMALYIFMSFVTASIISVEVASWIGTDVVEGSIAINLIKPINYKTSLFFKALGDIVYNFFIPSIFIWIGILINQYVTLGELPPSITTHLLYFISLSFGFVLLFLFEYCFGMLAFYTSYIWGMRISKNAILAFLSGQIIPFTFFPNAIRVIFSYLPFASINYIPVMIYLNKVKGTELIKALTLQVVWIILLYILSRILWKKATKKLYILGG